MECVGIFVGYDSDVIAGELGSVHGIGRRAICSRGRDGVTAARDGDGLIGPPGHYVLIVCRSSLAKDGFVPAKADLPSQSVELGAVDSIGAVGADKASRYILDAAGSVFTAYCNIACCSDIAQILEFTDSSGVCADTSCIFADLGVHSGQIFCCRLRLFEFDFYFSTNCSIFKGSR